MDLFMTLTIKEEMSLRPLEGSRIIIVEPTVSSRTQLRWLRTV